MYQSRSSVIIEIHDARRASSNGVARVQAAISCFHRLILTLERVQQYLCWRAAPTAQLNKSKSTTLDPPATLSCLTQDLDQSPA